MRGFLKFLCVLMLIFAGISAIVGIIYLADGRTAEALPVSGFSPGGGERGTWAGAKGAGGGEVTDSPRWALWSVGRRRGGYPRIAVQGMVG